MDEALTAQHKGIPNHDASGRVGLQPSAILHQLSSSYKYSHLHWQDSRVGRMLFDSKWMLSFWWTMCRRRSMMSRLGKICVERAPGLRSYYLNLTAGFIRWGAEWGCMYVVNRSCHIASPLQERFNKSKCIKHMWLIKVTAGMWSIQLALSTILWGIWEQPSYPDFLSGIIENTLIICPKELWTVRGWKVDSFLFDWPSFPHSSSSRHLLMIPVVTVYHHVLT